MASPSRVAHGSAAECLRVPSAAGAAGPPFSPRGRRGLHMGTQVASTRLHCSDEEGTLFPSNAPAGAGVCVPPTAPAAVPEPCWKCPAAWLPRQAAPLGAGAGCPPRMSRSRARHAPASQPLLSLQDLLRVPRLAGLEDLQLHRSRWGQQRLQVQRLQVQEEGKGPPARSL